jgi:hypothetical protein
MNTIEDRIARIIGEYDRQGWHRTGTDVDLESASWLAGIVRECGAEPTRETFALDRVIPRPSYIDVGDRRIDGLPLFDSSFTETEGIRGQLGPADADPKILLVDGSDTGSVEALEEARRSPDYTAIVFITTSAGDDAGLAPRNAPSFTEPFGPPVLQVDRIDRSWLTEQASAGSTVAVVARADREPVEAANVAAVFPGRDRSLPPLVVMTPRSGWWWIAAERGGGIVCWLEVMMALRDSPPERDVRFVATSGHELGHLGLEAYLDRNPGLATEAVAWMHFGASIGAAVKPVPRLFTSDDELHALAVEFLQPEVPAMPESFPHDMMPGGESRNIHARGGRYVSLAGGHASFHQQIDRWPDSVDVAAVVSYARAMTGMAMKLAG